MANEHSGVKFFIIATTIVLAILSSPSSAKEEDEGSLFELAQSLLQESVRNQNSGSGVNVLSGLVQGLMQTEGGRQLGDMLTKSKGGTVDLISNLASLWQASKFNVNVNSGDNNGNINIDPSVIGSMVDLFSTLSRTSDDAGNNNVDENNNDKQEGKKHKTDNTEEPSMNWNAVLSFAGGLLSSMTNNQNEVGGSSGGVEPFLSLLQVLMNTFTGQHNPHQSHAIPHHTHVPFLPPLLENLHEYWDYFINSDFGRTLWVNSGLKELVKSFRDTKGDLEPDKVFQSLENNTFRRRWIKSISSFLAQWIKHFTDPDIQRNYLQTGQIICNGFLQSQGYPRETLIDLNRPAESISALVNAVFKRQFHLDVNSEAYVGPAVLYIQELFKIGQKKSFGMQSLTSQDIETKLAGTIESDVIDPILRVNRAYKFSMKRRECAKYVICAINQPQEVSKSGLKPGVTKLFSLGASWYISLYGKQDFWALYNAAVEGIPCSRYDKNCSEFHTEDKQATKKYYHNEL